MIGGIDRSRAFQQNEAESLVRRQSAADRASCFSSRLSFMSLRLSSINFRLTCRSLMFSFASISLMKQISAWMARPFCTTSAECVPHSPGHVGYV